MGQIGSQGENKGGIEEGFWHSPFWCIFPIFPLKIWREPQKKNSHDTQYLDQDLNPIPECEIEMLRMWLWYSVT